MEEHPRSPPLISPIHDWNDATYAMMLSFCIDEWMDCFPPITSDVAPKRIKYSKRKAIASRRSDFQCNDEDANEAAGPQPQSDREGGPSHDNVLPRQHHCEPDPSPCPSRYLYLVLELPGRTSVPPFRRGRVRPTCFACVRNWLAKIGALRAHRPRAVNLSSVRSCFPCWKGGMLIAKQCCAGPLRPLLLAGGRFAPSSAVCGPSGQK